MNKRLGILAAIFAAGLLIVGINSYFTDYTNKYNARTCTAQVVEYTSSSIDDLNLDIGTNATTTAGKAGERNVCVNDFGTVMSNTVLRQPVNEVISHGTKQPVLSGPYIEQEYEEPEYEGGAICNDGWRSYSVGRGTCSQHGGVDYYL